MCGIVGYVGKNQAVTPVIEGLQALEYRGYDSAGITYMTKAEATTVKQVGRVEALRNSLAEKDTAESYLAIGHTRWATHGSPTTTNAHPHHNTANTIFAVHNGIIENFAELRARLKTNGYQFISETDTEVIPHLIDFHYQKLHDLGKAFAAAVKELQGAYGIAMCSTIEPKTMYAARLSSPLVLGVGTHEMILASDPNAVMSRTKQVVYIDDYEILTITQDDYHIKSIKHDTEVKRQAQTLDYDTEQISMGGYPHFMLKEIFEAPATIQLASLGRVNARTKTIKLGGLESVAEQLQHIDRVVIVACGTASFASMIGEYCIEELANIPVEVHIGSEFKYRQEPFSRGTALIVVSQSGETADTIAAVKKAQKYGALCLGVVNAVGSTIARITDAGVYCHAGTEQAVASTKAFMAQVLVLLEIALYLGRERSPHFTELLHEIESLPKKAERVLEQADDIKKLAQKYKQYKDFLFIGRRYAYPTALEGALKLKECALKHAEGFAAGEMKHGPLALIDEQFPTVALIGDGPMFEKTLSNIEEIRARKGRVLAVATEGNKVIKDHVDDVVYIPKTLEQTEPILQAIVVQLFAYYMAVELGHNVDRPRNLAKSVTVE